MEIIPNVGGGILCIVTLVKVAHPLNASLPIFVTLAGIVTLVNSLQPSNARSSILVTPLPIVTLVNPVHPENALVRIFVMFEDARKRTSVMLT
jgi:hypothetical protein